MVPLDVFLNGTRNHVQASQILARTVEFIRPVFGPLNLTEFAFKRTTINLVGVWLADDSVADEPNGLRPLSEFKPLVRSWGRTALAIFISFALIGLWHQIQTDGHVCVASTHRIAGTRGVSVRMVDPAPFAESARGNVGSKTRCEEARIMKIETSDRAKEFIVEHGGNVYVWSDDAGFDHTSTKRPNGDIEFASTDADGFTSTRTPRSTSPSSGSSSSITCRVRTSPRRGTAAISPRLASPAAFCSPCFRAVSAHALLLSMVLALPLPTAPIPTAPGLLAAIVHRTEQASTRNRPVEQSAPRRVTSPSSRSTSSASSARSRAIHVSHAASAEPSPRSRVMPRRAPSSRG